MANNISSLIIVHNTFEQDNSHDEVLLELSDMAVSPHLTVWDVGSWKGNITVHQCRRIPCMSKQTTLPSTRNSPLLLLQFVLAKERDKYKRISPHGARSSITFVHKLLLLVISQHV